MFCLKVTALHTFLASTAQSPNISLQKVCEPVLAEIPCIVKNKRISCHGTLLNCVQIALELYNSIFDNEKSPCLVKCNLLIITPF
jgi:hypothetical protein